MWTVTKCRASVDFTLRNKHNVQRFLGLVQYLAHVMPDISAYTGPLATIQKNGHPFLWKPMHQVCMDNIKALACKVPILCPIDPLGDEPIWVICDASASGIGAVYGQGPDWQSCRPAGFMSKKFTAAQHNYRVLRWRLLPSLKPSLNGRTNYSATALMWSPTIGRLNSSRPKEGYPAAKCGGWNI